MSASTASSDADGVAATSRNRESHATRLLDITELLEGRTHAVGVLETAGGLLRRRFDAEIVGSWTGAAFTLRERFTLDDGSVERRTWQVRRASGGEIVATASDVVGEAIGQSGPGSFRMRYVLKVKVRGWTLPISFDDRIYAMPDGTALNRATLRFLGIRVGELTFHFRKT